jgi:hypothetical protein
VSAKLKRVVAIDPDPTRGTWIVDFGPMLGVEVCNSVIGRLRAFPPQVLRTIVGSSDGPGQQGRSLVGLIDLAVHQATGKQLSPSVIADLRWEFTRKLRLSKRSERRRALIVYLESFMERTKRKQPSNKKDE